MASLNYIYSAMEKHLRIIWLCFLGLVAMQTLTAQSPASLSKPRHPNQLLELPPDSLRLLLNQKLLNQPDSVQILALELLQYAQRENATRKIFDALGFLGLTAGMTNHNEEALAYFRQQRALFPQIQDPKAKASVLMHMGNVFNYREELDSAAHYWFQALHLFENIKAYDGMASCYNNIGLVYEKKEDWETAKSYYDKSLEIRQKYGTEQKLGYCYNRLGNVYFHQKDYPLAQAYYQKYLKHSKTFKLEREQANALSNLGNVAKAEGDLAKAVNYYQQALALFERQDARYFTAYLHNNLAEALLQQSPQKAFLHSQTALRIAQNIQHLELQKRAAELQASAAARLGRFQKAYASSALAKKLTDSLYQKEQLEKFARLEARYRAEQAQKELAEQKLALQRESNIKYYILWGSAALFISLLLAFLYLRNRELLKRQTAELHARLSQAEANKLRELNEFKSHFIANISHEFKTPLTLILSALEQKTDAPSLQQYNKTRQIIEHHAQRLLQLIQRLLQLAKLESGNFTPQPAKASLAAYLQKWTEDFKPLAIRKKIKLETDLPEDFVQDYFDAEIVQTILSNLLSNAIKFCREGDTVKVSMKREHSGITLIVSDTGPGMTPEQLKRLFERFSPTTTSSLQTGSGLGLALARELAQNHGGHISIQSKPQEGSRFCVSLRTDRTFFEEIEALSPQETSPEKTIKKQKLPEPPLPLIETPKPLLLIAEDDEELRHWLVSNLQEEYDIIQAANGQEALQKIQEHLPDFVLLDVSMPLMDGYELCRQIKNDFHCNHIPVIMLTAHDSEAEKLKGLSCGATAYLTKPFYLKEIRIRLTNLLEERQHMQQKLQKELTPFSAKPLQTDKTQKNFLLRLRQTLEQHISNEQFGVAELASEMLLSRSQLHRKIKALTGCSPSELIRKMRLLYAFELLKKKQGNISEIAYQCGFSSPAYFSTCFKEQFGHSPSELPD